MEDPSACLLGRIIAIVILGLIILSSGTFMIATLPEMKIRDENCPDCEPTASPIFHVIEVVCVVIFTVEYGLRLLCSPFVRTELLDNEHVLEIVVDSMDPIMPSRSGRVLNFVMLPANLIDLIAIAPSYLEFVLGSTGTNLTVLRVIRLTRLFRLMKLGKYFVVLQIFARVLHRSARALYVLIFYLAIGVCFSASLIHHTEGGQWDTELREYVRTMPDGSVEVTPFPSIPESFWWCVVTYTTTGYGDSFPVSTLGQVVATCTMLVGLLMLAMPISVISSNFNQVWSEWYEEKRLEVETENLNMGIVQDALEGLSVGDQVSKLLLEIWDDDGFGRQAEFLGEVQVDLPVKQRDACTKELTLPLQLNKAKKKSGNVTGNVIFELYWEPDPSSSDVPQANDCDRKAQQDPPEGLGSKLMVARPTWSLATNGRQEEEKEKEKDAGGPIMGQLTLTLRGARSLINSDWKTFGKSDPYAVATLWPKPPDSTGLISPETLRTATIENTLNPDWDEQYCFRFEWPGESLKRVTRIQKGEGDPRTSSKDLGGHNADKVSDNASSTSEDGVKAQRIHAEHHKQAAALEDAQLRVQSLQCTSKDILARIKQHGEMLCNLQNTISEACQELRSQNRSGQNKPSPFLESPPKSSGSGTHTAVPAAGRGTERRSPSAPAGQVERRPRGGALHSCAPLRCSPCKSPDCDVYEPPWAEVVERRTLPE